MEDHLLSDNCPICLEPMASRGSSDLGDFRLKTPCDHVFHGWCLLEWFRVGTPGNYCPLCKTPMRGGTGDNGAVPVVPDPTANSVHRYWISRLLALQDRALNIHEELGSY